MIKPLKEWTVKELYDQTYECNGGHNCKRCPFRDDKRLCDAIDKLRLVDLRTLDIYAESGGAKYARDN